MGAESIAARSIAVRLFTRGALKKNRSSQKIASIMSETRRDLQDPE
ncbi:hypothetical protein [Tropheryma whipplei]|nr:hypothetical protein [Tropheryma whipplei]